MPEGVLTVLDGDVATVSLLDPSKVAGVAGALLDIAGPAGVQHITSGPTGSAFVVSKETAEKAGLVDKPAPAKKTAAKKAVPAGEAVE